MIVTGWVGGIYKKQTLLIELFHLHLASSHTILLEQKKVFKKDKSSTPKGLVWDTNTTATASCEKTL